MTRALPPPGVGIVMVSDFPRTGSHILDMLPMAEGGWELSYSPTSHGQMKPLSTCHRNSLQLV